MNFQKIGVPVLCVVLLAGAWYQYGSLGVMAVGGGLTMWLLLHWSRMMQVLRRAADRPMGTVASAVMLNAKLKPGVSLLHVVALTRSLGELRSEPDAQPEVYRWTDNSESHVTLQFQQGKLVEWVLHRPTVQDEA